MNMPVKTMATKIPSESIECLALIKPGSKLARKWQFEKPTYCIYEYDRGIGTREIRFGDGSGHQIVAGDHVDLILLPEFGPDKLGELFV